MGIKTDKLNRSFTEFIKNQTVFFVATAAPVGRVNVSPKGLDSLRIINDQEIVWLSVSGSGNETAAHILQSPRMTLMFCSFDKKPLTLRVYGNAEVFYPRHKEWESLANQFPDYAGARNIYRLKIDLVTTSCGTGVPIMALVDTRAEDELIPWYEELGEEKIKENWEKKNVVSLDGDPTGIFEDVN